jgi:hypothetical protein
LIVLAVAIATVLNIAGCAPVDSIPAAETPPPQSAREIARYRIPVHTRDGSVEVIEFRDTSGRLCVYAHGSNGRAGLDCVRLPPLDYENLPDPESKTSFHVIRGDFT